MTFLAENEYYAFKAADDAWSAELHRLFGRHVGHVRYVEEGRTGPTLAPLHAEFRRTNDAWLAAIKKARGEL